jgi:outer membrane protein assembly factor BamB
MRRLLVLLLAGLLPGFVANATAPSARGGRTSRPFASQVSGTSKKVARPLGCVMTAIDATAWPEYGGDGAHSNVDVAGAPSAGVLYEQWVTPVLDGALVAEPVVSGGCLIVATENDSVYAFDAFSGAQRWHIRLGMPVPASQLPCGDISPSGVTSTPVVSSNQSAVWVSAFVETKHGPVHRLFEVAIKDGTVLRRVSVSLPGLRSVLEQQRAGLVMSAGNVYVGFGGLFGGCGMYRGAIVEVPAAKGPQRRWYAPVPKGGGVWEPGGPDVLPGGRLVFAAGDSPRLGRNRASVGWVVELNSDLRKVASFAPASSETWRAGNEPDLASTAPALLPDGEVFQVGTSSFGYLLVPKKHLPGFSLAETLKVCRSGGAFGNDAVHAGVVYVACEGGLTAVAVRRRRARVLWTSTSAAPGPPVWAGGKVWLETTTGLLEGIDPTDGRVVQHLQLLLPQDHFPWLVAVGETLYAVDGRRVIDLTGL